MRIKPISNTVFLKVLPAEAESSILWTPPKASNKGKVLSVGPGRLSRKRKILVPTILKVGDIVIFDQYQGSPFSVDSEEYLLLSEDNIVAIVD